MRSRSEGVAAWQQVRTAKCSTNSLLAAKKDDPPSPQLVRPSAAVMVLGATVTAPGGSAAASAASCSRVEKQRLWARYKEGYLQGREGADRS